MRQVAAAAWGFVAGGILITGASMRWGSDLSSALFSTNGSTLAAGFGGAALGGLISFVLARQTSAETLHRDTEARTAEEFAAAVNAFLTAMQLTNRVYTLNEELKLAVNRAGNDGPWTRLRASTGTRQPAPRFTPTDFVPFIETKAADLIHRCMLLADRADALEASMDVYGEKRQELDRLAETSTTTDVLGESTTTFSGMEARVARFKARPLNQLIMQMLMASTRDVMDGRQIMQDMDSAIRRRFGNRMKFKFELVDSMPLEAVFDPHRVGPPLP